MNGKLDIHPKVVASSVSGSLAVCVLYVLDHYAHLDLPPEVGGAITILIGSFCGWLAPVISTPKK